jgi:hypothetical protein
VVNNSAPFDHNGATTRPFQIPSGQGFASIFQIQSFTGPVNVTTLGDSKPIGFDLKNMASIENLCIHASDNVDKRYTCYRSRIRKQKMLALKDPKVSVSH